MAVGINRNIVECKYRFQNTNYSVSIVLIETLWNVNFFFLLFAIYYLLVLIETLWNVNDGCLEARDCLEGY